jgi:arsenate reductase
LLTTEAALDLLTGNGNLVKRPFVPTSTGGLVGFRESEWDELLGAAPDRP